MDPKYSNKLFIGGKDVLAVSTDSVVSKMNSVQSLADGTYGPGGNISGRTFNIPRVTITDGIIAKVENSSETVPANHCSYCAFCTYCGQNHCTKCPNKSQYTSDRSQYCFVKCDIETSRGIIDVSDLVVGDKVVCDDCGTYEVISLVEGTLKGRKVYIDGECILTDDHVFFDGSEYFTMSENVGDYRIFVDDEVVGEYKADSSIVSRNFEYSNLLCEMPRDTKTYSPILKSNKPVFVTLPSGIRALFPIGW